MKFKNLKANSEFYLNGVRHIKLGNFTRKAKNTETGKINYLSLNAEVSLEEPKKKRVPRRTVQQIILPSGE